VLIFFSVVTFIGQHVYGRQLVAFLQVSDLDVANAGELGFWRTILARLEFWRPLLATVLHGQIWRLVTPIFLHFGFLHIFFNMLWLRDLGSMIEGRQSSLFFTGQVLAFAVVSNLAQFFVAGGGFGGMSGVVYGLVGYIWIRGKLDPGSGVFLHSSTVTMMIIWFFVCLIGIMGPVANTAHAAGLLMGMAWGYLSSLRR